MNLKLNSKSNHEVHCQTCKHLPNFINRLMLGLFFTSNDALLEAQKQYSNAESCKYCSNSINDNPVEH
jgi:hypothetical protein